MRTFTVLQWLSSDLCTLQLLRVQTVITVRWDYSAIRAIYTRYVTPGKKTPLTQMLPELQAAFHRKEGSDTHAAPVTSPLSGRQPAAPGVTGCPRDGVAVSLRSCVLGPNPPLITFTSVSPPAAERNCFTRPPGLVPTLLSARGSEHAAKLMTVFTPRRLAFVVGFVFLVFRLSKSWRCWRKIIIKDNDSVN